MKQASIYSTKEGIAYQLGTSRTLVTPTGMHMFQKKENGVWRNGRHSYAHETVEKVKAAFKR